MSGKADVVMFLVASGAARHPCNAHGDTPLDWATRNGHVEVVSAIMTISSPESRSVISNLEFQAKRGQKGKLNLFGKKVEKSKLEHHSSEVEICAGAESSRLRGASEKQPPSSMNGGWCQYVDEASGSPYWFCEATGESRWTEPLELDSEEVDGKRKQNKVKKGIMGRLFSKRGISRDNKLSVACEEGDGWEESSWDESMTSSEECLDEGPTKQHPLTPGTAARLAFYGVSSATGVSEASPTTQKKSADRAKQVALFAHVRETRKWQSTFHHGRPAVEELTGSMDAIWDRRSSQTDTVAKYESWKGRRGSGSKLSAKQRAEIDVMVDEAIAEGLVELDSKGRLVMDGAALESPLRKLRQRRQALASNISAAKCSSPSGRMHCERLQNPVMQKPRKASLKSISSAESESSPATPSGSSSDSWNSADSQHEGPPGKEGGIAPQDGATAGQGATLGTIWVEYIDPGSGHAYLWNERTGQSVWKAHTDKPLNEAPVEVEVAPTLLCGLCQEKAGAHIMAPCGHCCCLACGLKGMLNNERCPVCHTSVTSMTKINSSASHSLG
jgi:hypothetical protein